MMHEFLSRHQANLIERCAAKVAQRPARNASPAQIQTGISLFLSQLIRTLQAEQEGEASAGADISGPSGGAGSIYTEMGVSAAAHGKALLALDYTVDQVVHDYGDLCQAITDLAFERDAPFSVDEFRTLNRCLDNAIADAVTEFGAQRDIAMTIVHATDANQRHGFLMHELRNSLSAAMLATDAIRLGNLALTGATGAVLRRSLEAMAKLIERSLIEVKEKDASLHARSVFSLAELVEEAKDQAQLRANARGCQFEVSVVAPDLYVEANREGTLAALANLLSNAFKFTHANTKVILRAYAVGERVKIEVEDRCGGLRLADPELLFAPFCQRSNDKTGVGLGLSIARKSVEADDGALSVRNLPGEGCVFTIELPRRVK